MALTRVECAVRSDTADIFVGWDLVEKIRQHWSIANTAGRHLNGPYRKCFFIDPNMYLTPKAAFRAAMFACMPFAFALSFDTCAVYQQMQRSG